MKSRFLLLTLCFIGIPTLFRGQNLDVQLSPVSIPEFKGLQSYAWAKNENKILLIGGRIDGLHQKQPFASFNRKYNNTNLIVIDLQTNQIWSRTITELSQPIWEQLQSTNMEFWQDRNQLILIGGYGYSDLKNDFITHPALSIINVSGLINAIIRSEPIGPFIKQLTDQRMAITGGNLAKLEDTYLLIGGQRFDGRYNPHGPDHGPGYLQQYSNEVRKFELTISDDQLQIFNYSAENDTALYHRRDYTLLPQYNDKGEKIYTIFSGVFRPEIDLPYYTLVDVSNNGGILQPNFSQAYSHYHTAAIAIFDSITKTQFSLFFGGIAQYYTSKKGEKVSDNNVPFTKTISVIKRTKDNITEYALKQTMPGYLGASAHFIPASESILDAHGLINYKALNEKPTLIGYIIGGIESSEPNVFWDGDTNSSKASNTIWKVNLAIN